MEQAATIQQEQVNNMFKVLNQFDTESFVNRYQQINIIGYEQKKDSIIKKAYVSYII